MGSGRNLQGGRDQGWYWVKWEYDNELSPAKWYGPVIGCDGGWNGNGVEDSWME